MRKCLYYALNYNNLANTAFPNSELLPGKYKPQLRGCANMRCTSHPGNIANLEGIWGNKLPIITTPAAPGKIPTNPNRNWGTVVFPGKGNRGSIAVTQIAFKYKPRELIHTKTPSNISPGEQTQIKGNVYALNIGPSKSCDKPVAFWGSPTHGSLPGEFAGGTPSPQLGIPQSPTPQ